jgi:hypothetical protein
MQIAAQCHTEQRAADVTSYPGKRIRATRGAFKAPGTRSIPLSVPSSPLSANTELAKNGWLACRLRIRRSGA